MFITKKKYNELIKYYQELLNQENEEIREENKNLKICLEKESSTATDLREENEKLSTKISILETFIRFEYNKEIDRLENIKRKTKKIRVKKKCESRILDYKSRLLAFER